MFFSRFLKLVQPLSKINNARRLQSSYNRSVNFFLRKNLLLTNCITSGLFMGLGDYIQQKIEAYPDTKKRDYDWYRTGRMLIVGGVLGPLHHYYYVYLDKIWPRADLRSVGIKILWDQLACSPLTILCFFYGMGYLEKHSTTEINDEVKEKFMYVYLGDWFFWPPVQFINFYYLPTHYRVLYINIATTAYDVFLSFMKHYDQHEKSITSKDVKSIE
ncbi:mpv17-like protein 2 [Aricia agestis]|uniref:mpv17-like protein 2 n=1 Tax=Aricia agestis TaxID=91739 RepID=UPI001C203BB5|nr:mpv17-like protein 2 [Aricia agestis]